ncbi:MAG: alpha-2-macroglobulin [Pirellulales bacterium]
MHRLNSVLLVASLAAAVVGITAFAAEEAALQNRDTLLATFRAGNFREAYDGLSKLLVSPQVDQATISEDLNTALDCLRRLNRMAEVDTLLEGVAAAHADSWQAQAAVAGAYGSIEHYGFMIGGEFRRGQHRGGGRVVHATARDRVRALQLFRRAVELAEKLPDKSPAAPVLRGLAQSLAYYGDTNQYWRLQSLTGLESLGDYEEGWGPNFSGLQGAPVDEDGKPVFYDVPDSWDAAKNDGERWRWTLATMVDWNAALRAEELVTRAAFLQSQFDVATIAGQPIPMFRNFREDGTTGEDSDAVKPTWALDTLGEDETIARLATGIERFKLPDDQNFIKLYQRVVALQPPASESDLRTALTTLASIFENRRQFDRAAEYWRLAIDRFNGDERQQYQNRLDQIVGHWGEFGSALTQPAGRGATIDFRFRNATHVDFTAQPIDIQKLLGDLRTYLNSRPKQLDADKLNIADIGYRLVQQNETAYVGESVAKWEQKLEPRSKHFDRRITVTTPLQTAGAYLVTAKIKGGNTCKIVLWLADTAIVRKPMGDRSLYFVADAASGAPLAKANVEFLGYRVKYPDQNVARPRQELEIQVQNFAENTDANGQAILPLADGDHDQFQWLAIATAAENRLAYLGFHNVWRNPYLDEPYNQVKAFVITDRPVYRPEQSVEFKVWVRRATYEEQDSSMFAHQAFKVEIQNPKGEKVYSETLTSDKFGGIAGTFKIPADATLGLYYLQVVNHGGGSFRVEEYKKPEFEVSVEAPTAPVQLGEKITATIQAKYYFGAPVVEATVKYKVYRSEHTSAWFPPMPWDWLYGPGYAWFSYDHSWFPGWREWGCTRPVPSWWWRAPNPPELVVEREAPIGPDGTLKVEIETSLALAARPDQDHRYEIQVEVTDQSRRTITGSGQVLVSREPFRVFAWVDRGYFRVGDTINANFAARRLDGQGVEGTGKLRLLKISYADKESGVPIETEVRTWELNTNEEGRASLPIKASEQGQYRLAYAVTDKAGRTIEGGYLLTIVGEGFDGSDFRFNDLEIVPEKSEYGPGEKVQLQINTNRVGSTVLLFLRPVNGVYQPPQMLRLTGKSTIVQVDVVAGDMPNFFVEAVTISDARVHTQVAEIHVPPVSRILNVDVVPSAEVFQPGQHAAVKLKLTDADGKPFVGSTVVSIYDKSVEYISGGSNVPNIKEFFWKWRRQHQPHLESSLDRQSYNLTPPGETAMQPLGIFGDSVADETSEIKFAESTTMMGRGGRMSLALSRSMAVPESAPMAAAAPMEANAAGFKDRGVDLFVDGVAGPAPIEPTLRSEFADTALWVAALDTNADGLAEVALDMPQNLTTWRIRVWALGKGTRVGEASSEVVTRKNIIVRLQAPRFLVERDEVVLSANVHNYLKEAKSVKVRLEQTGTELTLPDNLEQTVEVPAGGERRVDWQVTAAHEGEAVIRMAALTDVESDAVEGRLRVYVHGMLKMDSYTGSLRPEEERGTFEITVPSERRAEQTRLEVQYSPTLAGAMVDALPYLVAYPYGCTEQTLNRFLPAVVTQQSLKQLGLNLKQIQEKRTNLNAGELGDAAERAKQWKRFDANPVFDDAEMDRIVKAGVQRLTEMQLSDGGWGWFSGFGEQSTAHTTATVVHGLQVAQANGVALVPGMLDRGLAWLREYQDRQLAALANVDANGKPIDKDKPFKSVADNIDAFVYMVLVDGGIKNDTMRDRLYRDRTKLAVYGLALYGVALEKQNENEKLTMVLRNLRQYLVEDNENQTAYLDLPENIWWYWYGSEFEAQAYFLKLVVAANPKDPVAPKLVKYLVSNRKHATYWNSTRDTALVIEALADYLRTTGEGKPDMTVEIWIDGQKRQEVKVTAENLFAFDNRFVLAGDQLAAGRHTIELRKRGAGPLYWSGFFTNFTLEDDIRAAGLELKVGRRFYKLTPTDASLEVAGGRGQVVNQDVEKFIRTEIPNLGAVESGDLVEVELEIESKNDYEYIMFEDMKAAGTESVALQSGYIPNDLGAYVELRDNRVTFFATRLARGKHSVSYRLRAETPGRFSALPAKASAMYAPELRGNSDELKLQIDDRPDGIEN